MAIRLIPQRIIGGDPDGKSDYVTEDTKPVLELTGWQWRPIVMQLLEDHLIDEARAERMVVSSGEYVSRRDCHLFAKALDQAIHKHGAFTCDGPLVVAMHDNKTYPREYAEQNQWEHVSPYAVGEAEVREVIIFLYAAGDGFLIF